VRRCSGRRGGHRRSLKCVLNLRRAFAPEILRTRRRGWRTGRRAGVGIWVERDRLRLVQRTEWDQLIPWTEPIARQPDDVARGRGALLVSLVLRPFFVHRLADSRLRPDRDVLWARYYNR